LLEIKNISKTFSAFKIEDISFEVSDGEYFILLGESGAGKSVILEIIAGLINADNGNIILNGQDITRERIQKRMTGLVFQDHAIFPHMTVFDNIAYPLKNRKYPKAEIKAKVIKHAEEMNISHLLSRTAVNLSGGEMQRIALARTLALEPKILLLDEPFASLDVKLKSEFRSILKGINKRGISILHVTHDYDEAIGLADKVAVFHKGKILQTGTPEEVFKNPLNRFVAAFVGVKNFFPSYLKKSDNSEEREAVINDEISFKLISGQEEGSGYVFIRSKSIIISDQPTNSSAINMFRGTVKEIYKNQKGYELIADIGIKLSVVLTQKSFNKFEIVEGKNIWLLFKASALRFRKD